MYRTFASTRCSVQRSMARIRYGATSLCRAWKLKLASCLHSK
jgi:hypothetical protein